MTVPGTSTPTSLLAQWANQEDGWVRSVVADVLKTKAAASNDDIERYLQILLREKGLGTGPAEMIPALPEAAFAGVSADGTVVLKSLKITGGVNAIADGQGLAFGSRLTVVFGENGSGKSGYVRVLKRAAGIRIAEPILGNVYKAAGQAPSAAFEYELEGTAQPTLAWANSHGLPPLTQMAIFDARASHAHVDEDLSYVYTPGELALFPLVQDSVDRVRNRLNEDVAKAAESRNPFLLHFKRGTSIYPLIEKLGAATNLDHLRTLATVDDATKVNKTQLEAEVESLRATNASAQIKVLEDQLALVRGIEHALTTVLGLDREAYKAAFQEVQNAQIAEKEVNTTAFVASGVPGVLEAPWKRFVEAGDAYIKSLNPDYPVVGEPCAFCRQDLTANAVALLQSYKDYCSGEARKRLQAAERILQALRSKILDLPVQSVRRTLLLEIDHGRGAALVPLSAAITMAEGIRQALEANQSEFPSTDGMKEAVNTALGLDTQLSATLSALRSKSTERDRLLASKQVEFAELEARMTLQTLWPEIDGRVSRAQWADGAAHISKGFAGTLRSVTEQAKVATQALLNTSFEQTFAEEVRALRAPQVDLAFPGAKGQALRRKIVADHKPSDVLSEGEQKVIALADFIAETRVREPKGPVVFDDPINSLDYRRAEDVALRIKKLSETRQVIVFTHSVMFASLLLDKCDRAVTMYLDIKNDGAPGIVSTGTHPRTDSVAQLVTKIDAKIAAAKKSTGEVQESLVQDGFNLIRNLTEVISEQCLLKGVSERYRAHVRVEGLESINVTDLQDGIKQVVDVYRKACRYIEAHSQPLDHLGVVPTVTELEGELRKIKDVREKHKG